ncbi:transglutaminase domain-containing protein [Mycoplasma sp. Mirounga ES2805-ORL]|uniref:transglutaminase domain-containing protein n=1 Tax=Mycoplasma sp. Mirounga ES2805-ORL TaxID=754514 RepID=UPI00197B6403|nr:transglutaminase domain-containing protein [Mycoplasma sp. Mirounga ES2805-ORL]QSF13842.1 hypothetical protein JXZ90_00885 [Mycoplasma sp. Mirounga ES2805-ORL]
MGIKKRKIILHIGSVLGIFSAPLISVSCFNNLRYDPKKEESKTEEVDEKISIGDSKKELKTLLNDVEKELDRIQDIVLYSIELKTTFNNNFNFAKNVYLDENSELKDIQEAINLLKEITNSIQAIDEQKDMLKVDLFNLRKDNSFYKYFTRKQQSELIYELEKYIQIYIELNSKKPSQITIDILKQMIYNVSSSKFNFIKEQIKILRKEFAYKKEELNKYVPSDVIKFEKYAKDINDKIIAYESQLPLPWEDIFKDYEFLFKQFNLCNSNYEKAKENEVSDSDEINSLTVSNNIAKARMTSIVDNLIGSKNITDEQINHIYNKNDKEIAKKLQIVWTKFKSLIPEAYDKMGGIRSKNINFKKRLKTVENFINNYWGYDSGLNSGPMANSTPIIKGAIRQLVTYKTFGSNQNYYSTYIDQLFDYLKVLEFDLSLTFDESDKLVVKEEDLDIFNINKVILPKNSKLTREEVVKFRKDIYYGNAFIIDDKNESYYSLNIKESLYSQISKNNWIAFDARMYELTNGSNYYNDVAWKSIYDKNIRFRYRTKNYNEEKQVNELVLKVIPTIISKNFNLKQKISAVHNWIVDNTEYTDSYELNNTSLQNSIRSVYRFVTGEKVVCEGYARMFQKFMTFLNIPSWYVYGDAGNKFNSPQPHAWNMVVVDGKNLFVDCTWDDPYVGNKVGEHSIINKNIYPHRINFLLKEWKEFSTANGGYRNIDPELKQLADRLKIDNFPYVIMN